MTAEEYILNRVQTLEFEAELKDKTIAKLNKKIENNEIEKKILLKALACFCYLTEDAYIKNNSIYLDQDKQRNLPHGFILDFGSVKSFMKKYLLSSDENGEMILIKMEESACQNVK